MVRVKLLKWSIRRSVARSLWRESSQLEESGGRGDFGYQYKVKPKEKGALAATVLFGALVLLTDSKTVGSQGSVGQGRGRHGLLERSRIRSGVSLAVVPGETMSRIWCQRQREQYGRLKKDQRRLRL